MCNCRPVWLPRHGGGLAPPQGGFAPPQEGLSPKARRNKDAIDANCEADEPPPVG